MTPAELTRLGRSRAHADVAKRALNQRAIHAQLAAEVASRRKGRFARLVERIFRLADVRRNCLR